MTAKTAKTAKKSPADDKPPGRNRPRKLRDSKCFVHEAPGGVVFESESGSICYVPAKLHAWDLDDEG